MSLKILSHINNRNSFSFAQHVVPVGQSWLTTLARTPSCAPLAIACPFSTPAITCPFSTLAIACLFKLWPSRASRLPGHRVPCIPLAIACLYPLAIMRPFHPGHHAPFYPSAIMCPFWLESTHLDRQSLSYGATASSSSFRSSPTPVPCSFTEASAHSSRGPLVQQQEGTNCPSHCWYRPITLLRSLPGKAPAPHHRVFGQANMGQEVRYLRGAHPQRPLGQGRETIMYGLAERGGMHNPKTRCAPRLLRVWSRHARSPKMP